MAQKADLGSVIFTSKNTELDPLFSVIFSCKTLICWEKLNIFSYLSQDNT